jgi:hypothetical protein
VAPDTPAVSESAGHMPGYVEITMSVRASRLQQTKRVPRSEMLCSTLKKRAFAMAPLISMMPHALLVNLLRISRSLLAVAASRSFAVFNGLAK